MHRRWGIRRLVDKGATLEVKDEKGWTPPSWVVHRADVGTVKPLIDNGVDIEAEGEDGHPEKP